MKHSVGSCGKPSLPSSDWSEQARCATGCLKRMLVNSLVFVCMSAASFAQGLFNDDAPAFSKKIETLLLDRNYAELDRLANELRRDRPVFQTGRAHLMEFYDALTGARGNTNAEMQRSVRDRIGQLEGWMGASKSVTPIIAIAAALNVEGSLQRGSATADRVSEDAMEKFHRTLTAADKLLTVAERVAKANKTRDPKLYEEWISAGIGLGFEQKRMMQLLDRSLEIDPWWMPTVDSMVIYSLPRWHGQPGDLKKLAAHVVKKTKTKIGETGYAIVAIEAYKYGELREFSADTFSWERTRTGLQDWLKQAPDSPYRLGLLLKYARINDDRETAAVAVRQLKGRWHTAVFPNAIDYLRAERWSRPEFREGDARLVLEGFAGTVYSTAFLDQGKVILGVDRDSRLKRFQVDSGKPLDPWNTEIRAPERSAISPDGTRLYLSGYGGSIGAELASISAQDGDDETWLDEFPSPLLSLAVDKQGRYVAFSQVSGVLRRWELTTPPQPFEWQPRHSGSIWGLAFSPDSELLASIGGRELVIWDLAKRSEKKRWQCHDVVTTAVAWSPDGKLLATAGAGNIVRLWNPASGVLEGELCGGNASISSLAFSSSGERLVAATQSWDQVAIPGEVVVWSLPDKKRLATLEGHALGITKVVISPDDKMLATSSEDATVRLWDLP